MNKNIYIDLMEQVFECYTYDHVKKYTETVKEKSIQEHGFPRLTATLGILISHGKKQEYKDLFYEMMNLCCEEIPVCFVKNGKSAGNDFSVKEIVFCLLELEKNNVFEKETLDKWRNDLAQIEPKTTYSVVASYPPKAVDSWANWAAFGAASEQLRKYAKIGDESFFIENQIKSQMFLFDENGMYRDPDEPMVYDFVTRLQLAIALLFGYEGESRKELEDNLLKSADITLEMLSTTGEIPYGGRSNQFLHNETFYAALCEFYATFLNKQGETEKAKRFKCAAKKSIDSFNFWISEAKMHHIKNFYPIDTKFGCEHYAYYDKYMITAASWLYLAYVSADDSIDEAQDTIENTKYICQSSEHFHKVFLRFNDYFVEIDTNADTHYDSSGIGRIQKKGVYSTICLSVPFSKNPHYKVDLEKEDKNTLGNISEYIDDNPSNLSIGVGVETDNGYVYTFDDNVKYELVEKKVSDDYALVKFKCDIDGLSLYKMCKVSDNGVEIIAKADGNVRVVFPVFDFDGEEHTKVSVCENNVEVKYKNNKCKYLSNGKIVDLENTYANRNGMYKAMAAEGKDEVALKIELNE